VLEDFLAEPELELFGGRLDEDEEDEDPTGQTSEIKTGVR
jgi:hypothetical protein